MRRFGEIAGGIDWILIAAIIPILLGGIATMTSFGGGEIFFGRQVLWVGVGLAIAFIIGKSDMRFFRDSRYVAILYSLSIALLVLVLLVGKTVKGAKSWFDFGGFSFQPTDIAKLLVIVVLAKYFSRRHIEIARIKHLFVSVLDWAYHASA